MDLDAGTFLAQWAAGGLLFGWVTSRRREVSLGYGWLIRSVFGVMVVLGGSLWLTDDMTAARMVAFGAAYFAAVVTAVALVVSVQRRRVGARGREEQRASRRARVAAMLNRAAPESHADGPEFPPGLDLVAALVAFVALLVAAEFAGGPYLLAAARLVVGAAFLGAVSDAMLLGHWYLVQPGLRREPVNELVLATGLMWPFEIAVFLWPTGMIQALNGTIDDGYGGLLGWIWIVCAITTIGLVILTWFALRERYYSAVMAATGLLYLAILTAFGVDLIARAVLAP